MAFVHNAPKANSGVLVLPMTIAPAARSFATHASSESGTWCAYAREPKVVRIPAVSVLSLIATGAPCRGPRSRPAARSRSARRASSSAWPPHKVMNAFSSPSSAAMRASAASTAAVDVSSPEAIAAASVAAGSLVRSVMLAGQLGRVGRAADRVGEAAPVDAVGRRPHAPRLVVEPVEDRPQLLDLLAHLAEDRRFVDARQAAAPHHDLAVHHHRVDARAPLGVDELLQRVVQRSEGNGVGPVEHEVGAQPFLDAPKPVAEAEGGRAAHRAGAPDLRHARPAREIVAAQLR